MSEIIISSDAFTGMVAIRVKDDLTHQALVLTPAEADELKRQLNDFQIERLGDEASQRESRRLKALTIYNGHSLPTVNRAAFEEEAKIVLPFEFVIRQRFKNGQTLDLEGSL